MTKLRYPLLITHISFTVPSSTVYNGLLDGRIEYQKYLLLTSRVESGFVLVLQVRYFNQQKQR